MDMHTAFMPFMLHLNTTAPGMQRNHRQRHKQVTFETARGYVTVLQTDDLVGWVFAVGFRLGDKIMAPAWWSWLPTSCQSWWWSGQPLEVIC